MIIMMSCIILAAVAMASDQDAAYLFSQGVLLFQCFERINFQQVWYLAEAAAVHVISTGALLSGSAIGFESLLPHDCNRPLTV